MKYIKYCIIPDTGGAKAQGCQGINVNSEGIKLRSLLQSVVNELALEACALRHSGQRTTRTLFWTQGCCYTKALPLFLGCTFGDEGGVTNVGPRLVSSVTTLVIRVNLSIVSVPSVCSKILRVAGTQHRVEVALVVNVCGVCHVSALRGIGMLILPGDGV